MKSIRVLILSLREKKIEYETFQDMRNEIQTNISFIADPAHLLATIYAAIQRAKKKRVNAHQLNMHENVALSQLLSDTLPLCH